MTAAWVLASILQTGSDELMALVERLGASEITEREEASCRLRKLGHGAAPLLERATRDADPETALRARDLLDEIELDDVRRTLRAWRPEASARLANDDGYEWTGVFLDFENAPLTKVEWSRIAEKALQGARSFKEIERICVRIAEQDLRGAIPALARFVGRLDTGCVEHALVGMKAVEVVPCLAPLLQDDDPERRLRAVLLIGLLQARGATPVLAPLLRDTDMRVRATVVRALGSSGGREAAGAIAQALLDEDPAVQSEALHIMGEIGATERIPAVSERLDDSDPEVRGKALDALARLGARSEIPKLVRMLEDPVGSVRVSAAIALADLEAKEAVPELVLLLKDSRWTVRHSAAQLLGGFEEEGRSAELAPLLRDPEGPVRAAAAYSLGELGDDRWASELARLLTDPSLTVREAAAEALLALEPSPCIPQLVGALEDPYPRVRALSLCALGRLRATASTSAIARRLDDKSGFVREVVAMVLGDLGATEYRGRLTRMLAEDDYAGARDGAAFGLCLMGSTEGVPRLLDGGWRYVFNSLRSRSAWNRLEATRLHRDLAGTRREVLEQIAASAGLRLAPGSVEQEVGEILRAAGFPRGLSDRCAELADGIALLARGLASHAAEDRKIVTIRCRRGRLTLGEALRQALDKSGSSYILEPDRIHIVTCVAEQEFWGEWRRKVVR